MIFSLSFVFSRPVYYQTEVFLLQHDIRTSGQEAVELRNLINNLDRCLAEIGYCPSLNLEYKRENGHEYDELFDDEDKTQEYLN